MSLARPSADADSATPEAEAPAPAGETSSVPAEDLAAQGASDAGYEVRDFDCAG